MGKAKLERELAAYEYDRRIAVCTLDHRSGYISEDIHGICTRTIKECDKQIKLITQRIMLLRADKVAEENDNE